MSTKPLASVQMITYNHVLYLRRAVESVLVQRTDFPFELIIGEDCSTDGTRAIALEYQRRYPGIVRVVSSDRNVGMHRNVVRTQAACRGDFLAFCEGDDYWHDPTKLQTQVGFLAENCGYGLAHSNYDLREVDTGRLRRSMIALPGMLQDDNAYVEVMLRRRRIQTLTVCARRELLERVTREQPECTDERWPMGDTQRWLEICRLAKVKYFPRSMATYNALPNSASRSSDLAKNFAFSERAGQLILHYLEKYPIEPVLERKVRTRVGSELLALAYQARNREKVSYWLARLREINARLPLEARLYLIGTRGCYGALAAESALWLTSNWRKARDKFLSACRACFVNPLRVDS